jgi:hypothetical protein
MRRRHGIALAAVAAVLATGVTGVAIAETGPATTEDPPAAGCGLDRILVPTCKGQALFGAWPKDYATGTFRDEIEAADARYKRRIDVVHTYHAPPPNRSPIPFDKGEHYGQAERHFTEHGRIVLANFKPGGSWTDVANKLHDDTIRQAARNIKEVAPHKVMLVLHHEPEDDVYGGGKCTSFKGRNPGNTVEAYRAMWQHTRSIFDAEGVYNVVWVMNYMGFKKWDCMLHDLWPGNKLVDWVAFDTYSINSSANPITRFTNELKRQTDADHDFTGKPYMLAEYGVDVTADKQAQARTYYDSVGKLLDSGSIPNLKALVVFDSPTGGERADGSVRNYSVAQDANGKADLAEQEAFNRLAAHPKLKPVVAN